MRNFSLRLARRLNAHLTESVNENELRFGIENLLIQMILVLCMSLIAEPGGCPLVHRRNSFASISPMCNPD